MIIQTRRKNLNKELTIEMDRGDQIPEIIIFVTIFIFND